MSTRAPHKRLLERTNGGHYFAECRCGWSGGVHRDRYDANRAWEAHRLDPDAPTGHDGQGDQCTCFVTDPRTWTTHFGAVEPGSMMEPNPDCRVHWSMNPSESLRRDIVEVRDRHMAEAHRCDTEAGDGR